MKSILRALFAVAAAIGLSSCLDMKSVVTVNKDGTGTVEETVLLSAQVKQMLDALGAQPPQPGQPNPAAGIKGLVPDKAKSEERAKVLGEGVTVKTHEEVSTPDGKSGVKVTYAVADIRKLKYVPFSSDDKDGNSKPMTFALAGDTVTVTNPPPDKAAGAKVEVPEIPAELQAQLPMMKPMFAGMRMTVVVKGGSGIANTNGTHVEGDSVVYTDVQIDKFIDKPDIFGKFVVSTEKKMSMTEAAEWFKGVDGIKIEPKETVTIKLK